MKSPTLLADGRMALITGKCQGPIVVGKDLGVCRERITHKLTDSICHGFTYVCPTHAANLLRWSWWAAEEMDAP